MRTVPAGSAAWATDTADGVRLSVRVIPNAARAGIVGEYNGALKIKLQRPPADGRANTELIALLADQLGCSKSSISIIQGETAREKVLLLQGLTAAVVCEGLLP